MEIFVKSHALDLNFQLLLKNILWNFNALDFITLLYTVHIYLTMFSTKSISFQ